jgi:hypothetical protein
VDHATPVGIVERLRHLARHRHRLEHRQLAPAVEPVAQRLGGL